MSTEYNKPTTLPPSNGNIVFREVTPPTYYKPNPNLIEKFNKKLNGE